MGTPATIVADLRALANRAPVAADPNLYVALRAAADRIEHLERVLAYEAAVIGAQSCGVSAIKAKRQTMIDMIIARLLSPATFDGVIANYEHSAALYATARSCVCTDRGREFYGDLLRSIGETALAHPLGSPERNILNDAFERIIQLESVLAVEAHLAESALSLKAISGSRRRIIDGMIDRMRDVASGGMGDYSHTGRMSAALDRLRKGQR